MCCRENGKLGDYFRGLRFDGKLRRPLIAVAVMAPGRRRM